MLTIRVINVEVFVLYIDLIINLKSFDSSKQRVRFFWTEAVIDSGQNERTSCVVAAMGTLGTETTPSTWTQEAGLDAERGDELHHPLADAGAGDDHALHGGHALAEHEEGHPREGAVDCTNPWTSTEWSRSSAAPRSQTRVHEQPVTAFDCVSSVGMSP